MHCTAGAAQSQRPMFTDPRKGNERTSLSTMRPLACQRAWAPRTSFAQNPPSIWTSGPNITKHSRRQARLPTWTKHSTPLGKHVMPQRKPSRTTRSPSIMSTLASWEPCNKVLTLSSGRLQMTTVAKNQSKVRPRVKLSMPTPHNITKQDRCLKAAEEPTLMLTPLGASRMKMSKSLNETETHS